MCVVLGSAMAVMWWLFATDGSATSSLVFVWGWLAGVPAAAALGVRAGRRHVRPFEGSELVVTRPRSRRSEALPASERVVRRAAE